MSSLPPLVQSQDPTDMSEGISLEDSANQLVTGTFFLGTLSSCQDEDQSTILQFTNQESCGHSSDTAIYDHPQQPISMVHQQEGSDMEIQILADISHSHAALTSDLVSMPLETLAYIPGVLSRHGQGDSGANVFQSAPTVLSAKEDLLESSQAVQPTDLQTSSSKAFQPVSEGPFGVLNPAGLLSSEGTVLAPSLEQSSSLNSISNLSVLKSIDVRLQNSIPNNFANSGDFQVLFSQKNTELQLLNDSTNNSERTAPKKLLNLNSFPSAPQSQEELLNYRKRHSEDSFSSTLRSPNQHSTDYVSSGNNNNNNNKVTSYSGALAPPNSKYPTAGVSPDCGVLFERVQGSSLDSYALAIQNIVGKGALTFIGREPENDNSILAFVKTPSLAESIVAKGIWLKGKWLLASYLQQPATKLTISGVMPFIPDGLIIEALSQYGSSVYPALRRIPAAVKLQQFKGTFSYRREIYLIKNSKDVELPPSIIITFLGIKYNLELSTLGAKCFFCGSLLHTITKCDRSTSLPIQTPHGVQDLTKDASLQSTSNSSVPQAQIISEPTKDSRQQPITAKDMSSVQQTKKTKESFSQCNLATLPSLYKMVQDEPMSSNNDNKNNISVVKKKNRKKGATHTSPTTTLSVKLKDNTTGEVSSIFSIGTSEKSTHKASLKINSSTNSSGNTLESQNFKEQEDGPPCPSSSDVVQSPMSVILGQFSPPDYNSCLGGKKMRKSLNRPILDVLQTLQEFQGSHVHLDSSQQDMDVQQEDELVQIQQSTVASSSKETVLVNPELPTQVSHSLHAQAGLPLAPQVDHIRSSLEDFELATSIVEQWIRQSSGLKVPAKKRLISEFLQIHPDMEALVSRVLSVPDLYPRSSARGKKVRDLLQDIRAQTDLPRPARIQKKRV